MDSERRQSFRWKSDPDSLVVTGVLHTKRGDVEVSLYDRSRLGFGVLIPDHCKYHVRIDEELAFSLEGATSLVRIAHQTQTEVGLVVGLQVLRELPSRTVKKKDQRQAAPVRSSIPFQVCLYAAVFLVIGLVAPWNDLHSAIESGELAALLSLERETPSTRLLSPLEDQDRQVYLAHSFFQLNQLRSPQLRQQLNLSASQQREISRVLEEATASMETVFKQRSSLGDPGWTEAALELLLSSASKIEAELTEQQLDQWSQLMNSSVAGEPTGGA